MKKKIRNLLFIIVCAVSVIFVQTFAWLQVNRYSTDKVILSDAEIDGIMCFVETSSPDNKIEMADLVAACKDGKNVYQSGKSVKINFTDPSSPGYFGNIRIAVKYSGSSPVFLRVRFVEQWMNGNEFTSVRFINYSVPEPSGILYTYDGTTKTIPYTSTAGEWYDNRMFDLCYYYTAPVMPETLGVSDSNDALLFLVNGLTDDEMEKIRNYNAGDDFELYLQIEAVQPNRFRELWQIEELPWKAAELSEP